MQAVQATTSCASSRSTPSRCKPATRRSPVTRSPGQLTPSRDSTNRNQSCENSVDPISSVRVRLQKANSLQRFTRDSFYLTCSTLLPVDRLTTVGFSPLAAFFQRTVLSALFRSILATMFTVIVFVEPLTRSYLHSPRIVITL